jgi:DNA-binding response OmpR family regulator
MPEMDGYQLCEAIKSDAQYCHLPFILLTAKTTTESKIMGLEYGVDAYLEKPFSLDHLRTQINNLLNSRQQLRELFASSPLLPSADIAIAKKDREFVDRLNAAIEENLHDINFSIDTLSEILHMSRSNFYRKIKGISGMSPNDYLKMLRLKKAAELL